VDIVLRRNHRVVTKVGVEYNFVVVYIADRAISDMHEYRCGESCKS
jgi:hypothetical protein